MNLKDNQKRAKEALLAFYVLLGLWCFNSFLQGVVFNLIQKNSNDGAIYLNEFNLGLNMLYRLVYLLCVVFFLRWFRRAYYNLHQLNVSLSYSEGWAVGSWFVPLLNLFAPYMIMTEIWKHTQAKANQPSLKSNLVIIAWWLTFISNFLITPVFIYFSYEFLSFDITYLHFLSIMTILCTFIAFLLIIWIIKKIAYWENIIYNGDSGMAIEDHLLPVD